MKKNPVITTKMIKHLRKNLSRDTEDPYDEKLQNVDTDLIILK